MQARLPDAVFGSVDQYVISHYLHRTLIPLWLAYLNGLSAERRAKARAILVWDQASTHTALGRSGDEIAEKLFLYFVPAECTSLVSPLDVGGCFRSLKAAVRRSWFSRHTVPDGADPWAAYALNVLDVWLLSKGYAETYSEDRQWLQCGFCTSSDSGQHHLHSKLKRFLRDGGNGDALKRIIKPDRVLREAYKRQQIADLTRPLTDDEATSTDEGQTEDEDDGDDPSEGPDEGEPPLKKRTNF